MKGSTHLALVPTKRVMVVWLCAGQVGAKSTPSEHDGATEQQQVQLAERQLLPVHEHIVVGLPPFWAVTSPDAAALRAHFFLRVHGGLPSPLPSRWSHSHRIVFLFERLYDLVALFPPCAKCIPSGRCITDCRTVWCCRACQGRMHSGGSSRRPARPPATWRALLPGTPCQQGRAGIPIHIISRGTPELQDCLNPEIAMIVL